MKMFIVDDHRLFAESLTIMLKQASQQVSKIFTSSEGIEESIISEMPNIVLLDVSLENESGVDLCKRWTNKFPFLSVIGLSMHHEYRYVVGMKKAGAKGYLLKNSGSEEFLKAIACVKSGGYYFEGEVANILTKTQIVNDVFMDINPRERKVLERVIEGKTSKQIAEELAVSIKAIEFYRGSLLLKFEARNAIELVNKTRDFFK